MRMVGRVALGLVALLAVLVAVVLVRTFTYKGPAVAGEPVKLAAAQAVDADRAARNLSAAIQIRTVRHQDRTQDELGEWARFHAFLQTAYPKAHEVMRREAIAHETLVYTWQGSDASLAPIILMAHQDVVPVTPGTEKDWKHPPFEGIIAEGAVWGRGAIDDKGSLIPLFEAVETLATQGFQPRRTIILVLGGDEEVQGGGAQAATALLKARGVKAEFVLDEGMAIVSDNPVTGGKLALIGTAEKGYGTLKVTAKAAGGHSSTPPEDGGGVVALAKAVTAIASDPFPMAFRGPGADLLRHAAPGGSFLVRMAVANEWLFRPLLIKQVGASPAGAAMLHTTIAPTMLKGSPKENVLPQDATAWINYRIAPGDTAADVIGRARGAADGLPVDISWNTPPSEPTRVSSTSSWGWRTLSGVASAESGAPVAPALVVAGTDSRWLEPVAKDVYRFQPLELSTSALGMIHGTNEHVSVENLGRAVRFFTRLMATSAG
ncbi:MAG: M20 family peptidase [Pseudomonadota bacterium]